MVLLAVKIKRRWAWRGFGLAAANALDLSSKFFASLNGKEHTNYEMFWLNKGGLTRREFKR